MSPCVVCPTESIGAGAYPFLCVPHALVVAAVAPAPFPPAPFTALEIAAHATKWRDLPQTSRARHAVTIPEPDPDARDADDSARLAAVTEVMRSLGGVPLRTEATYGEPSEGASGPLVISGRLYLAEPSRAVSVDPGAAGVPRNARVMAGHASAGGWSVRLRAVEDPPSVVLRAWRGGLFVVVSWVGGRFTSAWVMRGRDLPIALGARQASALVKS